MTNKKLNTPRSIYHQTLTGQKGKENEAMPLSFVTEQQRVNAIAANKAEEDEIISNLIEGAIVYEHDDADFRGYVDVDDGHIGFGSCLKTQFMLDAGGDGGYAVYNIPIVLKDEDGEIYVTSAFLIPHGSTTGGRVSGEMLQSLREWQDMSDNK